MSFVQGVKVGGEFAGLAVGGAVLGGISMGGVGYLMSHAVSVIFPSCAIDPISALVIWASSGVVLGCLKGVSWALKRNLPDFYEKYQKFFEAIEKIILAIVPAILGVVIAHSLGFAIGLKKIIWFGLAATVVMAIGLAVLAGVAVAVYAIYKAIVSLKNPKPEPRPAPVLELPPVFA